MKPFEKTYSPDIEGKIKAAGKAVKTSNLSVEGVGDHQILNHRKPIETAEAVWMIWALQRKMLRLETALKEVTQYAKDMADTALGLAQRRHEAAQEDCS